MPGQENQHQIVRQGFFRDGMQRTQNFIRRRIRIRQQNNIGRVVNRWRGGAHQARQRTGIVDGIGQVQFAALKRANTHAEHMQRHPWPLRRPAALDCAARSLRPSRSGGGSNAHHADFRCLGVIRLNLSGRVHRGNTNNIQALPQGDHRFLHACARGFLTDKDGRRDHRVISPNNDIAQPPAAFLQTIIDQQGIARRLHRRIRARRLVQHPRGRATARPTARFAPAGIQHGQGRRQATAKDRGDIANPFALITNGLAGRDGIAQRQPHQIGAEEYRIELADFHEFAGAPIRGIAAVTDQRAAIRLAIIAMVMCEKTFRCPHDPALRIRLDEQGHQFLAGRRAVPNHRAIAQAGNHAAAIGADIHRPDRGGGDLAPRLPSLREKAHIEIRAERNRGAGLGNRDRARRLRRVQPYRRTIELRRHRVFPVRHHHPRPARQGGVHRWLLGGLLAQFTGLNIEHQRPAAGTRGQVDPVAIGG